MFNIFSTLIVHFLYFKDTYPQLLIPSMKSYVIDDLYSNFTFPLDYFIIEKSNKLIKIGGAEGSFDYVVYGERKDIDKLEIEPLKV